MLGGFPSTHVQAGFAYDFEDRGGVDAVDAGQIDPGHPEEIRAQIEGRGIAATPALGRWGQVLSVGLLLEGRKGRFDPLVALGDLPVVEVEQIHGLLQGEEVLLPPMSLKSLGNGGLVVLAPVVPHPGQLAGIALPVYDGPDDLEAGDAGDVADDVLEFDVHLGQGLLHVLDVVGGVPDEHGALAQVGTQDADLSLGTEGSLEQSEGMELLEPLAIEHVGLASRNTLEVAGIDQPDGKAPLLEDLEQGDPVDAGGFHDHGGDVAAGQPLGQGIEIGGEGAEPSHVAPVGVASRGHGHEVAFGGHVDAGSVEIDLCKLRGQLRDPLFPTPPFCSLLAHGLLRYKGMRMRHRAFKKAGRRRRILPNGIRTLWWSACHQ